MFKTIITGVDGSDTATSASRRAAELAQATGAQLYVLSAYGKFEIEKFYSGSEEYVVTNEADAEEIAANVARELRRDFPDVTITAAPAEGKPAEALVKAAERYRAELIVVGNKGVQGLSRVLGSVARDVATHAHCDVYVAYTHRR